MVIVGGEFEVDPAQRDAFLAEREAMMRTSRAEDGCLEYTFAADPLADDRVILFERWESQAALDAHLAATLGKLVDRAAVGVDHDLRRGRRAAPALSRPSRRSRTLRPWTRCARSAGSASRRAASSPTSTTASSSS